MSDLLQGDPLVAHVSSNQAETYGVAWNHNRESAPPCCTVDDFKIDLWGSPRTPWNQSAAYMFLPGLIEQYSLPPTSEVVSEVLKAFYSRVKTLQANFRARMAGLRHKAAAARRLRRANRKRAVGDVNLPAFITRSIR